MNTTYQDVEHYIATQPEAVRPMLELLRKTIKAVVPEAEETISYQMPAYTLRGPLVYFAAYKNHIGFYPTGSGIQAFQQDIKKYKNSKGAVQFPLNQPLPVDLIRKIVLFKTQENINKKKQ